MERGENGRKKEERGRSEKDGIGEKEKGGSKWGKEKGEKGDGEVREGETEGRKTTPCTRL